MKAFSLIELVVTVALLGILAAISIPAYSTHSARAKVARSQADLEVIRNAFMNHYYDSMLAGHPEFPPAPADSHMTQTWADTAQLFDGSSPASLFSDVSIPHNPMDNPYKYGRFPDSGGRMGGFRLRDPDILTSVTFQP